LRHAWRRAGWQEYTDIYFVCEELRDKSPGVLSPVPRTRGVYTGHRPRCLSVQHAKRLPPGRHGYRDAVLDHDVVGHEWILSKQRRKINGGQIQRQI
jgi:hypothetical protein